MNQRVNDTVSGSGMNCEAALFARAVEIADEAMTELLMSHTLRGDEHGVTRVLVDEDNAEVETLLEADPAAIEAVRWLQDRGLCEVVESSHGATIVLLSLIGEEAHHV